MLEEIGESTREEGFLDQMDQIIPCKAS